MDQEEVIIATTKRVVKNTGALLAGNIISKLCSLALLVIAARHIGAEGFGKFTFALSFTGMFIILGDLGLNTLAIREIARDRTLISKYLGDIGILKTILSLLAVGIIFLVINLLNYPPDTTKIVYIIAISVFFSSLSMALRWVFQAFQKMEYEALVNIVQGLFFLGAGLIALYLGKGLVALAIAHLSTSIAVFCFSFLITVKNFAKPKFEIDFIFWKYLIKEAIPIGLMNIFVIIYLNTNTVLLSLIKGDTVVGWYNAGYKLVEVIKIIPSIFILAIFPVMSEFYKTSSESLKRAFKKTIQYMLLSALPIAIGITILSYKIIPIFWGKEFFPATSVLQILVWMGAISFISAIMHNYLVAVNKQKIPIYTIGVGLIVNIFLNLILVPKLSYFGSSLSILTAQFVIFLLVAFYIFYYFKINPFPKQTSKIVSSALLMGLLTWFIKDFNIILVVFLSVVFYFAVLIILKGIGQNDFKLVRSIIKGFC